MAATRTCTRNGCGASYDPDDNGPTRCEHHPGAPVFHEGMKGWSCCSKRVVDFDAFLKIPGCAVSEHTDDRAPDGIDADGKAVYGSAVEASTSASGAVPSFADAKANTTSTASATAPSGQPAAKRPPAVLERAEWVDPPEALQALSPGASCRRPGCDSTWSPDGSAPASTTAAECRFHVGEPVFHEGSKSWSCCSKRKVLEFDEFLKIPGCASGAAHRFTDPGRSASASESASDANMVAVRHDWYQTQTSVIISLFAKKADASQTRVDFDAQSLTVSVVFKPDAVNNGVTGGRARFHLPALSQPVDVAACRYEVLGTKIEIVLKKANGYSWPALEPQEGGLRSWTTFGTMDNRGGTVGAKEARIASDTPVHLLK
ncbi:hypothetical protein CXG81DRAFT_14093 [Caulochytrium protostelioides]|uniref:Chord-domain-containing protein n=1 Tax=Caulochytrium protostelioides TaxID=1555241 RepID=A0A4P9X3Y2_9FUNG|nr:chord-domain-containing protein [Caulochytrium protostelioides]RKO99753.1 hypothetical protein CXG81DRAFT_14093 [Caulochytrium protostelioides]|eukprot:RKO99753.1 hypothetical protein CXG81DRAFT_14093 [Caulochytrium protostelioides]